MSDLDDLKATQEQVIAAVNRRDLDAWLSFMHDEVVYTNAFTPFPVEGKAVLWQAAAPQFKMTESMNVTLINTQYRVIGNTESEF